MATKNPGATPHHGRNPKGDGQKSFMETLREVGGKELDLRRHESDLVVSVAGVVTGLMIAAIAVYKWFPVVSVVFLVCALIALWGRWVIRRQVLRCSSRLNPHGQHQMFCSDRQ